MDSAKPFKTHDELLDLLESRGIDFSSPESRSFAKKGLQRIGYYNLINGYSSLFWADSAKDQYISCTTIEEIYHYISLIRRCAKYFYITFFLSKPI